MFSILVYIYITSTTFIMLYEGMQWS